MTTRVALHHHSAYTYDRPIALGPHLVRLKPAPHCRTPIEDYSIAVIPEDHTVHWQQDPHGNYLGRYTFSGNTQALTFDVRFVAELTVSNPFDFFIEESAAVWPFEYEPELIADLQPYLATVDAGPQLSAYLREIDHSSVGSIEFLVHMNQRLQQHLNYEVRMEPGVQTPEQTLATTIGSCRDSAWLLVQIMRHLGLAARFVSGYLIQLKPDATAPSDPNAPKHDRAELHAWAEVYLPGAGWIGLDQTSGMLAGEGHIPLAATPNPVSAAPITGSLAPCNVDFNYGNHDVR